jgi:hypothetical protein
MFWRKGSGVWIVAAIIIADAVILSAYFEFVTRMPRIL